LANNKACLQIQNTDLAKIQENHIGLISCGASKEEADKLCEPNGIDIEEELEAVRETQKKEMSTVSSAVLSVVALTKEEALAMGG
jgi:hypothetical protein